MAYSVRVQFTVAGEAWWQVTPRQQETREQGLSVLTRCPLLPRHSGAQELVPSTFREGFPSSLMFSGKVLIGLYKDQLMNALWG